MITLTRRYRFPAAHVLRHPSLSDEENRRVYGKCARPNGHGHDYGVEVTVTGQLEPATGAIVPLPVLDALVQERVLDRFSHCLLNDDECFRDAVPTAENIARVIHSELALPLGERTGVRLLRVRVVETSNNHFEYGDPQ
jgi:6-pyruvoyltetrahydropterin/6-carboxytetrahydropterin synthase